MSDAPVQVSQLYGHVQDVVMAGLLDGVRHNHCHLCREVMGQAHDLLRELRRQLDELPTRAEIASQIADRLADPSEAWEIAGLITASYSTPRLAKGRVHDGQHR